MKKSNTAGVYQLSNGYWAYRYTLTVAGKRKDVKRTKDEEGNPFKTEKAAFRARERALVKDINLHSQGIKKGRVTFEEVFNEYCEKGRGGKAYSTIRKQDSLWRNHIKDKFGKYYIDEISIAQINDYLTDLYYVEGRAYQYVESFLKLFYLIYGQAYSRNYIDISIYNRYCLNKSTRISMPKMKADEDTEIKIFSKEEITKLDEYFNGSNAETAYMLGKHCGLRINECYGLKWDNVDIENGKITIDRQMQYQDGIIKLVVLKTHNAKRVVYMSEALKEYFAHLKGQRDNDTEELAEQRKQNHKMIVDKDRQKISSLELVNTLPNGKIQTINSMKYHAQTIRSRLGIDFKFHFLRHTYGTRLAELNTPSHILCRQMGHASGRITEQYYLAISQSGIEALQNNLNRL